MFVSIPYKTIIKISVSERRQKFSFTLISPLSSLLVERTFSFWYLEIYDLDQAKPAVYHMLLYTFLNT